MSGLKINRRDLELLSAYIDRDVTARQREQLEKRLKDDAVLRDALTVLRQTRAALRAAPQVRAPRSFALTPEMVRGIRRRMSWAGSLRMVSVLASFLFVVLLAGDLWLGAAQPQIAESQAVSYEAEAMAEPAEAAEAPAVAEVFTEKSSDAPLPPEPTAAYKISATGEPGAEAPVAAAVEEGMGGGENEADMAAPVDEDDTAGDTSFAMPTATLIEEGIGGGADEMGGGADEMRTQETPTSAPTFAPSATPMLEPTPTSIPVAVAETPPALLWLRSGVYLMSGVALVAGAWAWWLRKK